MSKNEAVIKSRMAGDPTAIPLSEARLCLNCDTVHKTEVCPICTSENSFALRSGLGSNQFVPQIAFVCVRSASGQNPVPGASQSTDAASQSADAASQSADAASQSADAASQSAERRAA